MKKVIWALALVTALGGSGLAQADVSPKDVQQALAAGNYPQAEQELNQVIAAHPDSAKAHYVLAQVLAKEGNLQGAQQQLNQASQIDPAIHFTTPEHYNSFKAELGQALGELNGHRAVQAGPAAVSRSEVAPAQRSHSSFGTIIGLLILLAVIVLVWRALSRSRRVQPNMAPPGYNNSNYGYNPQQPPPYGPPGGTGGSVLGQVATTAAGVAGGVLAAEAIEGMFHHGEQGGYPPGGVVGGQAPNDPLQDIGNSNIDMGTNDGSWDDSSGGGGDDNSW